MTSNAAHRLALEDIEVDVLVMSFGGDSAGAVRVPHHNVGIGTHLNRPFTWVEIEDLGGVGGGDGDELLRRELAGIHAFVPQHGQTVFDSGGAVRDLGKVVFSCGLLLFTEAAVIGGSGLQIARL